MEKEQDFFWKCEPQAEAFLEAVLEDFSENNSEIKKLAHALEQTTSTRLFDWIDHFILPAEEPLSAALHDAGFVLVEEKGADGKAALWRHPGAQLPMVLAVEEKKRRFGVAVKVDSIADFLMVRGLQRPIEGTVFSGFRRCVVSEENDTSLVVVERRGALPFSTVAQPVEYIATYLQAEQMWLTRPRSGENEEKEIAEALRYAEKMIGDLGQNSAAWIVLEVERKYWQARNSAAQLQKNRQDRLGMGWANHDHHTFRSSRRYFKDLVLLFERLGFHCRERFYAGKEAGWGAQVMENSACGLILFLDVDLAPHEIEVDFAHQKLPELDKLGTIGLWCALHGDSILQSGMHHLEGQFLFDKLKEDLHHLGVGMMEPFSFFDHLKQAFTAGEIWPVNPKRIEKVLAEGKITSDQAEKFRSKGAVGSHLENLQRREGYKGFNQKNVSYIIKKTDPRNAEISN